MIYFWSESSYRFLSNFHLVSIHLDNRDWPSVEHYYQAQKTSDFNKQEEIRLAKTPGKAKRLGQKILVEESWKHRKFEVMLEALWEKFKDPTLRQALLDTQKEILIEDSPKDLIWGSGTLGSSGLGLNMLGKLLMLVRRKLRHQLFFPVDSKEIPVLPHAGSFSAQRKHDIHTGIDLYCPENSEVFSMAEGRIAKILPFTGASVGSPWWEETMAVIIEHDFGFVLYGEIHSPNLKEGQPVHPKQSLGRVKRVLKVDKGLPMDMLHLEYYAHLVEDAVVWNLDQACPEFLLNPTKLLMMAKEKI